MGQPAGLGATGGPRASGGDPCREQRPGRRRRVIQARAATPPSSVGPARALAGAPPSATLLLNATYEPLCVVSSRRAIVLVLAEKAEPVDSADDVVHAALISLPVPVVVRLTRYVRVPYPGVGAAVAARGVHPRRPDLRLLRQLGDEHRPRRPAQPGRHAHLGQRRRGVPAVQPHEGRPVAGGDGLGAAAPATHARAAPRGGCWAPGRVDPRWREWLGVPESVSA